MYQIWPRYAMAAMQRQTAKRGTYPSVPSPQGSPIQDLAQTRLRLQAIEPMDGACNHTQTLNCPHEHDAVRDVMLPPFFGIVAKKRTLRSIQSDFQPKCETLP